MNVKLLKEGKVRFVQLGESQSAKNTSECKPMGNNLKESEEILYTVGLKHPFSVQQTFNRTHNHHGKVSSVLHTFFPVMTSSDFIFIYLVFI